jgi:hypothetical protein
MLPGIVVSRACCIAMAGLIFLAKKATKKFYKKIVRAEKCDSDPRLV